MFACHSWLRSGVQFHTAPAAPEERNPEIVPPKEDIMALPADAQPSYVIDRHRDRIAGRSDVRSFDKDSLMREVLRSSQQIFDYLVAQGIYSPLSDGETERLISASRRMDGYCGLPVVQR